MKTVTITLGSFLFMLATAVNAETWHAKSSDSVIAVLELFTSEGCGLCPAADDYVNALSEQNIDEEKLIVLGFHIDYLNNRKGWVDPFSKPEFTDRQKQLAHFNRYQNVFTPEMVVSGETVHSWREQLVDVIGFLNAYPAEVDIALTAEQQADTLRVNTSVSVRGEDNRQHSALYLAVTESELFSEVRGGDNAGQDFTHQNVVREWYGPFELAASGTTQLQKTIPLAKNWQQDQLKLVAVVQNFSDGYVLQGLALPLTP